MNAQMEVTLVLVAVSVACALPGVFLVLRRLSLVSDAISHVILLGIVVAFFVIRDLDSPLLLLGAATSGVLAVACVEALHRTRLVKEDAAIGLVFPALFALGVLLVSMYGRDIHIDIDSVLSGQAQFASTPRWTIGNVPVKPLAVLATIAALNAAVIAIFYKELKLATFDASLAAALGLLPGLLHYGLMTLVSLTAVASFDAVGTVLVVAFFIVPAATAYLLTDRLSVMLLLSAVIGAITAAIGTSLSFHFNTNIPGTIAVVLGIAFGIVFFVAPSRGLIAQSIRRWKQHRRFLETMLAIHLYHHEGTPAEAEEARLDSLHRHLEWEPTRVQRVVNWATARELVQADGTLLKLTDRGRELARELLGN